MGTSMLTSSAGEEAGLGWIDGWSSAVSGGRLEGIVGRHYLWSRRALPPTTLLQHRMFEPSLRPHHELRTTNVKLDISDLSSLSRLIDPGEIVGKFLPAARHTRHAVFSATADGTSIFVPAALLIRALWLWSESALEALMTPNGLDVFLGRTVEDGQVVALATGPLRSSQPGDRHLRTLSWLTQQEAARHSWGSVLTNAHLGVLDLSLPVASLSGWAWGIELDEGVLACELNAVDIQFELSETDTLIRMGQTTWPCPPPIPRRTGFLSF